MSVSRTRGGRRAANSNQRRRPRRAWVRHGDERLLDQRICDLDLKLERTALNTRLRRLHAELEARGIRFKPHAWLSSEWFSPDGIPGIAVPFFLAHPRLMKLEAKKMLEVEGGSASSCMRILRHEAGHAIDTAYRLHFRKRWRELFGPYTAPYPRYYRPKPNSRKFVLHLEAWYAQAHPAEDFAETFAVWLTPRSSWRQRYKDWPAALRKLVYVDELMHEVGGEVPKVRSRARHEPVVKLKQTLRDYYRQKWKIYGAKFPDVYDRDLLRLFSHDPRYGRRPTAASFLRQVRTEFRETLADWSGVHPYTIDQVLQDLIDRCRELKLRLAVPASKAKTEAILLLTVHTMGLLHRRRHEIPL